MAEDMEKDIECGAGELATIKKQKQDELYALLMKRTAIIATVLSVITLIFVFIYLSTRSVVLGNAVMANDLTSGSTVYSLSDKTFQVPLVEGSDSIELTLPRGTNSEDIVIENRVTTCSLLIGVEDSEDYYTEESSVSTPENVTGCQCTLRTDGSSVLEFRLDGIYEYTSTLDNGTLYVSFVKPHEMYDKIIVIDPVLSESAEGENVDAALYEAFALRDKLDKNGVKAYLLRSDSNEMKFIDKKALIKELDPDFVICIDCAADTTVYYNDSLYIRKYGNDDLAKQVLADISYELAGAGSVDNVMALTLSERPYELMKTISTPSVLVTVPKASKVSDGGTGTYDDYSYLDSVATGLYKAILYAYADLNR